MAQNMNVSVTLRLVDQFTQNTRAAIQALQQLSQAAQNFNRSMGGVGATNQFTRMVNDVRTLSAEVRNLVGQFNRLGRSMTGTTTGGSFAQQQVSDLRRVIQLQQQIIANNRAIATAPPGGPPPGGGRPGGGFFGRSGFSPNASFPDRLQYYSVNLAQRSLVEGVLDLDRARTALLMLATPRPDPDRPGQMLPGVITPEIVAQAEAAASEMSQIFRVLNRAHVLDTFREMVTQFAEPGDAFRLLPQLLAIQEWQVLQGETVERARDGMARLVRAMGLSSRLTDQQGRLNEAESAMFLDSYVRARMIGGRDVTPDQVFQVMRYLKTSGQTMTPEAILTAFIAMPDIRGSGFGNQIEMLRQQLMGTATQAAQRAMVAGGLGTITEREGSGPHSFTPVDPVLLNENIFEWFNRHILGPQGFLRRQGIDPMTASAAQIAATLSPMFSNTSARSIANAIVNQQAEWRTQVGLALRFNATGDARQESASGSLWYGLQTARSSLMDAMGATASNFRGLLLPVLVTFSDRLKQVSRWLDPVIGKPEGNWGVIGAGGLAGLLALRGIMRAMGPWGRVLAGAGLGFFAGGGVSDALLGGLLGRGVAGSGVTAAAGAAGAAAAATWGGRFLSVLRTILLRTLPGMVVIGAGGYALQQVIENWEAFKTRMSSIYDDLTKALPVWLGGEGDQGAHQRLSQQLHTFLESNLQAIQGYLNSIGEAGDRFGARIAGTRFGQLLGLDSMRATASLEQTRQMYRGMGIDLDALNEDARLRAQIPGTGPLGVVTQGKGSVQTTITTGPINVTVNVGQTNASPEAIGAAAGNAVGSGLRGALSDAYPGAWANGSP